MPKLEEALGAKEQDEILEYIAGIVKSMYEEKEKKVAPGIMRHIEKMIMLQIIDAKWKDHLYAMDNLREGIGLRAYGQRDPLVEYQHEGYNMFTSMIESIKDETVEFLFKIEAVREEAVPRGVFQSLPQEFVHKEAMPLAGGPLKPNQQDFQEGLPEKDAGVNQYTRQGSKVGRNDPCPCGSGKKYKKCCGR